MTTSDPDAPAPGRRAFFRGAALLAAATPILTEAAFARAAQVAHRSAETKALHGQTDRAVAGDAVMINANENPLGPSKAACEAIAAMGPLGGRYDSLGETEKLAQTFAAQNGLTPEQVAVYAGSSEPLHFTVLAFTSPSRALVVADPTYEAPTYAARTTGAEVRKVALTPACAHDASAMLAAARGAGVIYVCNPNNPTGTMTDRAEIVRIIDSKPKDAVVLVDEAYIHLADTPDVLDQVRAGKDVIVLRTFSKVYGMAGIRCGFAIGRPDLLARLTPYGQNAMPITGSAAARASLEEASLVPTRRQIIGDTRVETISWLKARGYKVIGDSRSNCFMIDTGHDGRAVMAAMKARNVYIGRVWPIWPNAVRITVGTPQEMATFRDAFHAVMSSGSLARLDAPTGLPQASFPHLS